MQVLHLWCTFQSFFLQSYCKLFSIQSALGQGQHRLFLESITGAYLFISVKVPILTSTTAKEPHWHIFCHFTEHQFSSCWQCKQATRKSDQAVTLARTHRADLAKSLAPKFSETALISRCFMLEVFKPGIKHPKATTGFNLSHTCLPTEHPKSTCMS